MKQNVPGHIVIAILDEKPTNFDLALFLEWLRSEWLYDVPRRR